MTFPISLFTVFHSAEVQTNSVPWSQATPSSPSQKGLKKYTIYFAFLRNTEFRRSNSFSLFLKSLSSFIFDFKNFRISSALISKIISGYIERAKQFKVKWPNYIKSKIAEDYIKFRKDSGYQLNPNFLHTMIRTSEALTKLRWQNSVDDLIYEQALNLLRQYNAFY